MDDVKAYVFLVDYEIQDCYECPIFDDWTCRLLHVTIPEEGKLSDCPLKELFK